MDIFFPGQIIPVEILKKEEHINNNKFINAAGNGFYYNLLSGLSENGCNVSCISTVDKSVIDSFGNSHNFNGVAYNFSKHENNLILRSIKNFFNVIFSISKWKKNSSDDRILIVNCLRLSNAIASIVAAKLLKIKILSVVTDVPNNRVLPEKITLGFRFTDNLGKKLMKNYDGFLLLSKDMNQKVNDNNKPYIVIEAIINPNMFSDISVDKNSCFTVMYAGALMRRYNIMVLVDAVRKIDDNNIKLIIYGSGELSSELEAISKIDNRIEYRGLAPQSEILKEELKAHLLVNPRSTTEEYTKYCFPSKNLEYILSSTPVLFTKLKSMPSEYYDYITLVDDESPEGFKCKIEEIIKNYDEYVEKAQKAHLFAKEEKNRFIAGKKTLKLIEEII